MARARGERHESGGARSRRERRRAPRQSPGRARDDAGGVAALEDQTRLKSTTALVPPNPNEFDIA